MKCEVCQERPTGANAGTLRWCGRCRRSWFADLKDGDGMLSLWAADRARRYERKRAKAMFTARMEDAAVVRRALLDKLARVEAERDEAQAKLAELRALCAEAADHGAVLEVARG